MSDAWAGHLGWAGDEDLVARAGVPVRNLASYLEGLSPTRYPKLFVDCAAGLSYAVLPKPEAAEAREWLEGLRKPALALGGYAAVMGCPARLRGGIDRRGYEPSAEAVMRRLKDFWDPAGILSTTIAATPLR